MGWMGLSLRVRILSIIAILLALALIAIASWQSTRQKQALSGDAAAARSGYPPPGRLIDIGGRRLHIDCTGAGSPTVVLVAGGGAYSIDWSLVQPTIAATTRVCSYDRAGLGWSDSGPADETVEQTLSDLHALLAAAGEQPPFILVGASIGGIYIQAYQHAYPAVSALVFTNSSSHVGLVVKNNVGLLWNLTEDQVRSIYPLPASAKGSAPTSEDDPFDRLPPGLRRERLWLDTRYWRSFDPQKTTPALMLSWRKEFLREFEQAKGGTAPPLGALPVMVVASDPAGSKADCAARKSASDCLDFLSSNTVHVTATGSGHEIHLYQPATLVRAIERTVLAVRNHAPLSNSSPPQRTAHWRLNPIARRRSA